MLQAAENLLVDIPKFWEYLAELVEPLFEDGAMTLGFLGPLSSPLGSSLAPLFVAAVLKELVIAQVIIMSHASHYACLNLGCWGTLRFHLDVT